MKAKAFDSTLLSLPQAGWSLASAVLVLVAASSLPRLATLGLRHSGRLPGTEAVDDAEEGANGAGRVWAARHGLHFRVVDDAAAALPSPHLPVELRPFEWKAVQPTAPMRAV